jgi:hypothetical protein
MARKPLLNRNQTKGIDNSKAKRNIVQPASNTTHIGAAGGRTSQPPLPSVAQNPITTNPMLGRPIWTYTDVAMGPVRGPQPRLAQGTGLTGNPSLPGNAGQLPGYLSDNEYFPTLFTYDAVNKPEFMGEIPKTIKTGDNGRGIVGTYQPHDFTPGVRFAGHLRQAAYWQVQEYPPNYRNLLAWQQVRKYRVNSLTLQARPLQSSDYFVGYQINPTISAQIGQSSLGSMGSM